MCDSRTILMIEEVVEEKVRAGEMFTAFDISLEVKERGGHDRHRHMKKFVHDYHCRGLMGGDYDRTLMSIPGAKAQAWLYHPKSADPNTYKPQPRRKRTPKDGYRMDRRSRVTVPVAWVRAAGLLPGNQAFIAADSSSTALVVMRDCSAPKGFSVLQSYKVEKDGNVRIARTTLARAGLKSKRFAIDADGARIIVKPFRPRKSR
jgi:hypothetical protein